MRFCPLKNFTVFLMLMATSLEIFSVTPTSAAPQASFLERADRRINRLLSDGKHNYLNFAGDHPNLALLTLGGAGAASIAILIYPALGLPNDVAKIKKGKTTFLKTLGKRSFQLCALSTAGAIALLGVCRILAA